MGTPLRKIAGYSPGSDLWEKPDPTLETNRVRILPAKEPDSDPTLKKTRIRIWINIFTLFFSFNIRVIILKIKYFIITLVNQDKFDIREIFVLDVHAGCPPTFIIIRKRIGNPLVESYLSICGYTNLKWIIRIR